MNTLSPHEIEAIVARAINAANSEISPTQLVEAACEGCSAPIRRAAFNELNKQQKHQTNDVSA